jgi:PAT family beta-lactamase induction signal transducer AmpG
LPQVVNLALVDPAGNLGATVVAAVLVGIAGATFDIVIDAYRIETLQPYQLGTGSGMSQYGWRIGSAGAGALALYLAARHGWSVAYLACAAFALPAMVTALLMGEPARRKIVSERRGLGEVWASIIGPFVEFFQRHGALLVLLFILLHKIGDTLANLTFRLLFDDLGFTNDEIALYDVGIGFWAYLIGCSSAGWPMPSSGLKRSVLVSLVLMGVSNLSFALLAARDTATGAWARRSGSRTPPAASAAWCGRLLLGAVRLALHRRAVRADQRGRERGRAFVTGTTAGSLIEAMGYVNFYLLTTVLALPGSCCSGG